MRDEGKTIAVGKVMKYIPYKMATKVVQDLSKKLEDTKVGGIIGEQEKSTAGDLVFNIETGKAEPAQPKLDGIAEGEEDEGDL